MEIFYVIPSTIFFSEFPTVYYGMVNPHTILYAFLVSYPSYMYRLSELP